MFPGEGTGIQSHSEPNLSDFQDLGVLASAALSPEVVRPHQEAPPKKGNITKWKKGNSQVLTETLVKNALIKELLGKKKCKDEKPALTEKKKSSKSSKNTTKKMPCRALLFKAENSSSDSENEMVFDDDSDIDVDMDDYTAEKDEVSVADFILVEFLDKRVKKCFAGEVKEDISEGYVVTFFWRKSPSRKFVSLKVVDESLVPKRDIVMKLPVPSISGGTENDAKALVFDISLRKYLVE
ncbi:hypothetical protein QYM36_009740 [Artemia franciscana]|uniref:Uncharacterized protein n=1 Tax=Artemia franciscana TaxID=6661 RepID=A0AA88HL81_ARTSF|nr:hypothetical protein QYM36_009740 [Artemia franciscana]